MDGASSQPAAPHVPDLDAASRELLRDGFESGIAGHGDLGLSFDTYALDVLALIASARGALGLETTPADVEAALRARALADLYVARACEAGGERAWDALVRAYEKRLIALAAREGGQRAAPEHVVSALLADLALPPARGGARTHIGTFAGMGALWAWLSTNLVRRIWSAERRRTREKPAPEAGEAASQPAPVWTDEVGREAAAQLEAALESGWKTLTREERVCFALKHHHGLKQRRIAALTGTAEYQVSRHVSRALLKIRGAVDRGVTRPGEGEQSAWEHLKATLATKLASFGALETPLSGGGTETGGDD